jgi:serine protease inhibitor
VKTLTDRAHLSFALDLHRALAPDPGRTACWSPFSVASALGLVAQGAAGVTREELVGLLLGDTSAEPERLFDLLAAAGRLDETGEHEDAPVLAVANTLWADQSISVRESFADELARMPGGAVCNAPFRTDPEAAREQINTDVARTTRDLIPELLPPGVIGPDTVAAVVNALYLKVAWRHRFDQDDTRPEPFHAPGGTLRVPTMRLAERVGYAARAGWQVVALPAVGGVRATVLLPDGELASAERSLDADSVAALLSAPESRTVRLTLPRLELSTRAELTPVLNALGVRTMFTREADLTGISPDPLAVQAVLHETVLKVDEQGLEGAAATAVMIRLMSMDTRRPLEVRVDRPFLLLVQHAATGALYFLARVTDPGTAN